MPDRHVYCKGWCPNQHLRAGIWFLVEGAADVAMVLWGRVGESGLPPPFRKHCVLALLLTLQGRLVSSDFQE